MKATMESRKTPLVAPIYTCGVECIFVDRKRRTPLCKHACGAALAFYGLILRVQGLPVRGQKTKTNARTRKGKPKAIAGKKTLRK